MNRIKQFLQENRTAKITVTTLLVLLFLYVAVNYVWPFIYFTFFARPVEPPKPPAEEKVLQPDPVDKEHPLPKEYKSYTGYVRKIFKEAGEEYLEIERDGAKKKIILTNKTYYQKGNGQGRKEDLVKGLEVKVLVLDTGINCYAMTVYYNPQGG